MRLPIARVLALFTILTGCTLKNPEKRAMTAQDSLHSIHLSDDFHVELVASEPDVMSPVEIAFDENGKIYVAEMMDYPEDPPPGKPARSRIRLLEDTNGDGKIDRVTTFADHLLAVSGFMPWKGGLIVTSAPDILYLKDTNGTASQTCAQSSMPASPRSTRRLASQTRGLASTTGSIAPTTAPMAASLPLSIPRHRRYWSAVPISDSTRLAGTPRRFPE
jgi:hypothetical protein